MDRFIHNLNITGLREADMTCRVRIPEHCSTINTFRCGGLFWKSWARYRRFGKYQSAPVSQGAALVVSDTCR